MLKKHIEKIVLYNHIIKLKPLWISHIVVWLMYSIEIIATLSTIPYYEQIIDQLVITALTLVLDNLTAVILLYFIIRFIFKKPFYTKNNFLLTNKIYGILWAIGIYICIFIMVIGFCFDIHT